MLFFLQRFKAMFGVNDPAKGGSFYLQSKIYRSKEVLEHEVLGIVPEVPQDHPHTPPEETEKKKQE